MAIKIDDFNMLTKDMKRKIFEYFILFGTTIYRHSTKAAAAVRVMIVSYETEIGENLFYACIYVYQGRSSS